jgi:hypothetical protein
MQPESISRGHLAHPVLDQGAQSRQAARLTHGRTEHLFLEPFVVLADDRDLQLFAGAEVGEDAGLAHAGDFGQGANRQALDAHLGSQAQGSVQDGSAGLLALVRPTPTLTPGLMGRLDVVGGRSGHSFSSK